MSRAHRVFLSACLSLLLAASPSSVVAVVREMRLLRDLPGERREYTKLEITLSQVSTLFAQLVYLLVGGYFEYGNPFENEVSLSTTGISDRPVLGLAPGSPVPVPGGVNSCTAGSGVLADPTGRFVLTSDNARNVVCVHSRDPETNVLTPVPGSPFPTGGTGAERIAVDASGQFIFVANSQSNNVTAFSLNLDTGGSNPNSGFPVCGGSQPLDVTTDGFGRFLYVANNLAKQHLGVFDQQGHGALTLSLVPHLPWEAFLSRVEADPLGRFLYAMDGQRVFVLSIGATGALTPAAGSPLDLRIPTWTLRTCGGPLGSISSGHSKHKIHWPERYGVVVPG